MGIILKLIFLFISACECAKDYPDWSRANIESFPFMGRVYTINKSNLSKVEPECNALLINQQSALTHNKCVTKDQRAEQTYACFGSMAGLCKKVTNQTFTNDPLFEVALVVFSEAFMETTQIRPGFYSILGNYYEPTKKSCRAVALEFKTGYYGVLYKGLHTRWTHREEFGTKIYDQFELDNPRLGCPDNVGSALICSSMIYGLRKGGGCHIGFTYFALPTNLITYDLYKGRGVGLCGSVKMMVVLLRYIVASDF